MERQCTVPLTWRRTTSKQFGGHNHVIRSMGQAYIWVVLNQCIVASSRTVVMVFPPIIADQRWRHHTTPNSNSFLRRWSHWALPVKDKLITPISQEFPVTVFSTSSLQRVDVQLCHMECQYWGPYSEEPYSQELFI